VNSNSSSVSLISPSIVQFSNVKPAFAVAIYVSMSKYDNALSPATVPAPAGLMMMVTYHKSSCLKWAIKSMFSVTVCV
jgi:hypothetical protein